MLYKSCKRKYRSDSNIRGSLWHSYKSENGNVFFLVGAIILGLLTWFVAFRFNAILIESARIQLEFKISNISSQLRNPSSHWLSVENGDTNPVVSFRNALETVFAAPIDPSNPNSTKISSLQPRGIIKVTRVQLVIPTMPYSEDAPYRMNNNFIPHLSNGPMKFSTFGASCNDIPAFNLADGDCEFFGSAAGSERINKLTPSTLVDNPENAGSTIVVLVEAQVRTFFGGILKKFGASKDTILPTVRVIRSIWSPVRMDLFPDKGDFRYGLNQRGAYPNTYPGLTIAISPHVVTTSYNDRFKLPEKAEYGHIDPFQKFSDGILMYKKNKGKQTTYDWVSGNLFDANFPAQDDATDWYSAPPNSDHADRRYDNKHIVYTAPPISPYQQSAFFYEARPGFYYEVSKASQLHGVSLLPPGSRNCDSCGFGNNCDEASCPMKTVVTDEDKDGDGKLDIILVPLCTCVGGNPVPNCSGCQLPDSDAWAPWLTGQAGWSACDDSLDTCPKGECRCIEDAGLNAAPATWSSWGYYLNELGVDSDFSDMLVSCINPLVLVRNAFLTTIVELASRHGQMRGTTEILMVGTQNQVPYNKSTQAGGRYHLAEISNPPVQMVPRGWDILRPDLEGPKGIGRFQLPYVFFYSRYNGGPSGDSASLNNYFGSHKGGWVYPFTKHKASQNPYCEAGYNEWWCSHQAVISQQLRMCHHLYADFTHRPFPPNIYMPDGQTGKKNIVPPDYEPIGTLAVSSGIKGKPMPWDQDCPWGQGTEKGGHCDIAEAGGGLDRPHKEGLTAAELVASIGTIQSCPYRQLIGNGGNTDVCRKPGVNLLFTQRDSLRADYRGLIDYLNGGQAVKSPGLFPLNTSYYKHPWVKAVGPKSRAPAKSVSSGGKSVFLGNPMISDAYVNSDSGNSPLLLVVHRTPVGDEKKSADCSACMKKVGKKGEEKDICEIASCPNKCTCLFDNPYSFGDCSDSTYPDSHPNDEVEIIQDAVEGWNNRPITVVFIPADRLEALRRPCLLKAFNIYDEIYNPTGNSINRLVEYGPYAPGEAFNIGANNTVRNIEDNVIHREYWSELLIPGSSGCTTMHTGGDACIPIQEKDSIYHRAHTVFLELLTWTENKL